MDLLFFIMPMAFFFTKDLFVLLWWIMCQILDQNQQTNEKIVVFSRDIAALKLIKRDFSTSSLFFDMKKWIFFLHKYFFQNVFTRRYTLSKILQVNRVHTYYIIYGLHLHFLKSARELVSVWNLPLIFFFLHPTVVSIHVTGLRLASPLKNASLALKILSKAVNIFVGNFKTLVWKKGQGNSLDSYSLYKSRRQV